MKYKHNYQIGLEDVDIKGNATNRALMTMMEDIGGLHSDSVGYGLDSVEQTGQAWVVLDWKIEIVRRPHYRDEITAYTWSRNHNIACAYRDFEYAKKAIRYNVSEYMLKPVTAMELTKVLRNMKEKLDSRKKEQKKDRLLSGC